jgi:hypothetical protein
MSILVLYTALRPIRRATDWSVSMGAWGVAKIPLASEIRREAIVRAHRGTEGFG